ncbi:MAG: Ig-like domain-containing protein [Xanthobacteraceae bacterium]
MAIGGIAFAAAAILLLSVGAAQAQVGGTATTTTLSASPNPAQVNQTVTLTATVAPMAGPGSPTGSVSFLDLSNGGSLLGTGTLMTVGGQQQAAITVSFPAAGTHMIQADYDGDTTFATSQSNQITETVNNAATNTTTNLTASPTTAQVNQSVTLTATVAPQGGSGTPTGTVTFNDLSNGGPPSARSR